MNKYLLLILFVNVAYTTKAKTWLIGPDKTYQFCSQVSNLVNDGDTVFIYENHYMNDKQVSWSKNNLHIEGKGHVILEAGAIIANDFSNGKGIFVVKGQNVTIKNIEFRNAKVPDRNGAGIRQEACNLTISNCIFDGNEMGILCGTLPNCKTTIEFCTFKGNGSPFNPGYQHNVYINNIDTLIFRYNSSTDAIAEGHELKSRAKFNYIAYNWIANTDSEDSRTIDLPNGGTALLIGNILLQGPNSANNNIIGYGLEGLSNPSPHNLILVNNTIINKKDRGSFIHLPSSGCDTLLMYNNILGGIQTSGYIVGSAKYSSKLSNIEEPNLDALKFVDINNNNFHLMPTSPCINMGYITNKKAGNYSFIADKEFVEGPAWINRALHDQIDIGAYELPLQSNSADVYTSWSITPNPFSSQIKTSDLTGRALKIYDQYGRLFFESQESVNTIETSQWPIGVYIACVGNKVHKLIKF